MKDPYWHQTTIGRLLQILEHGLVTLNETKK